MADYTQVLSLANQRLNDSSIKTSVYTNQQNVVCLRLTSKDGKTKTQIGEIKDRLGIKDGVIRANNNSYVATDRARWSDSATMDGSMSVPTDALGQRLSVFNFSSNKELREAVQKSK